MSDALARLLCRTVVVDTALDEYNAGSVVEGLPHNEYEVERMKRVFRVVARALSGEVLVIDARDTSLKHDREAIAAFIVGYLVDIDGLGQTDAEVHTSKVLAEYERTAVTSWIDALTDRQIHDLPRFLPTGAFGVEDGDRYRAALRRIAEGKDG